MNDCDGDFEAMVISVDISSSIDGKLEMCKEIDNFCAKIPKIRSINRLNNVGYIDSIQIAAQCYLQFIIYLFMFLYQLLAFALCIVFSLITG